MVIIAPKATVELGESSSDKETLSNCKEVVWEEMPATTQAQPQTVMNTVPPLDFHRPHKWVRGEIHSQADMYHAFHHNGTGNKQYIVPGGENVEIPYAVVSSIDKVGKTWKWTFTGFLPWSEPVQFRDGEDVIWVVPFVAKYATPAEGV
jgi:hypothetical protein